MALDTTVATPARLAPILDALDPEQQSAATVPDGPAQIIAPAASGTTTTLIARVHALRSCCVRLDHLLWVW